MIRVVVGEAEETKEFHVHEGIICPRSGFFAKAMTEPWSEADERKVTLSAEEPNVFSLYLQLLYVSVSLL